MITKILLIAARATGKRYKLEKKHKTNLRFFVIQIGDDGKVITELLFNTQVLLNIKAGITEYMINTKCGGDTIKSPSYSRTFLFKSIY